EMLALRDDKPASLTVIFSPDGQRLLAGSGVKHLSIWDTTTWKEINTLTVPEGSVRPLGFSPDGKKVLSTSNDYTVRIWDETSGKEILTLRGHEGDVELSAFSPDGQRI